MATTETTKRSWPTTLQPAVAILLFSIASCGIFFPWISQFPAGLIRDDGYFYAQIAYNIGTRGLSTFDGINPTDGYHQLWCYALAGLSWVLHFFTLAKGAHLFAYVTLNFVVIGIVAWIASERWLGRAAVVLLMCLCSFLMEGHLAMLWIAVALASLIRAQDETLSVASLVALFLLPITRVDAVLVFVPLLGLWFFAGARRQAMLASSALGMGIVLHVGMLKLLHGSWVTVSSEAKAANAVSSRNLFVENLFHGVGSLPIPINPMPLIFFALAALSCVLALKAPEHRRGLLMAVLGGALFGLIHLIFNEARPWYYTVPYGIFALCSLKAIEASPKCARLGSILLSSVCLLILGLGYRQARKYSDEAVATHAFLAGLGRIVPAGEAVYMVDGSGYAGWVADRPIVNGDGLVNSHEYMRRLRQGRLANYMTERGLRYFLTDAIGPDEPLLINVGGLRVTRLQADEVAVKPGNGRYRFTQLVLWRLK